MYSFLQNLNIRTKIILTFYVVILLISIGLGYISYEINSDNVVRKVSIANESTVHQIDSNIDFLQREIDDISMQLELQNLVQSFLNSPSDLLVEDKSLVFTMNLIATKSYINLMILYKLDDHNTPYHKSNDGSNSVYPFTVFSRSSVFQNIFEQEGKPLWFRAEDAPMIQNNKFPKIAMGRMVRDLRNYHNIGLLIMGVNEKYIRSLYEDNLRNSEGSIAIIDQEGRLLSQGGPAFYEEGANHRFIQEAKDNQEGSLIENVGGRSMLINYSSINEDGWRIFYAVPMTSLTKEVAHVRKLTIYFVMGCMIVLLPFLLLVSSLLAARLKKLLQSMKKIQEGRFDEYVEVRHRDEIGQLGVGFNRMVSNIKQLIERVYILQIREREAELDALQAQINPHFLYNTLDIIFWKSQASGDKEISEMVYSLSKFFRLSLNRGDSMTTVAREKELVEHYLLLQKKRFKQKLSYTIEVEEEALPCIIPKLILQPFVENAILHGLGGQQDGGSIRLTGKLRGGQICFVIEDDGIGMNEQKLQEMLSPVKPAPGAGTGPAGGFAVRNVMERLRLIYGEEHSIHYDSSPGHGTKVSIEVLAATGNERGEAL